MNFCFYGKNFTSSVPGGSAILSSPRKNFTTLNSGGVNGFARSPVLGGMDGYSSRKSFTTISSGGDWAVFRLGKISRPPVLGRGLDGFSSTKKFHDPPFWGRIERFSSRKNVTINRFGGEWTVLV